MKLTLRWVRVGALTLLLGSAPVHAADKNGRFATKGAGLATCGNMLAIAENSPSVLLRFAGWTAGYVSATNHITENTFDILQFETAETVFQYVYDYCQKHPELNFSIATANIVELMRATKLSQFTDFARVHPASKFQYYQEIIEHIFAALVERGLLQYADDKPRPGQVIRALQAFQKAQELPQTGDADQITLVRLLRQKAESLSPQRRKGLKPKTTL